MDSINIKCTTKRYRFVVEGEEYPTDNVYILPLNEIENEVGSC